MKRRPFDPGHTSSDKPYQLPRVTDRPAVGAYRGVTYDTTRPIEAVDDLPTEPATPPEGTDG